MKIEKCKSCDSINLKFIAHQKSFDFSFDIVDCQNCGLRFRNISLSPEETQQIYSDDYFSKDQVSYFFDNADFKKDVFIQRLKYLNQFVPQKGDLLDLGSAVGAFLEVAKADGYTETGLEISKMASEIACSKGLNSINHTFDNLEELEKLFDVITLWDVVDHSEKPLELLKGVRTIIKPNGYIFVETTVIDSTIFQLAEKLFYLSFGKLKTPFLKGYPVHHSNYYSSKSMRQDIEKAGFKVEKEIREPFGDKIFSGGKLGKLMFRLVEKYSQIRRKEIVCIIIAKSI